MAMPSSGVITADQFRNEFGDSGETSLSNWYRGGPFVPATRTYTETTVNTGPFSSYEYSLFGVGAKYYFRWTGTQVTIVWNDVTIVPSSNPLFPGQSSTSWISQGYQYERGSLIDSGEYYQVRRRTYTTTTETITQSVNTGVPTSGPISFSDLYGARDY